MEANDDILDELEMQKEPKVEVEWQGTKWRHPSSVLIGDNSCFTKLRV